MLTLESVTSMLELAAKGQELATALQPVQKEFLEKAKDLDGLDKSKAYFAVRADGSAVILQFDPQGQPGFFSALPLPLDASVAP